MKLRKYVVSCATFMVVAQSPASVWLGSGSSDDWSDSGNWNVAPSSGTSTALDFINDGLGSANHDLGSFTLNSLTFGNGLTGTFSITEDSGLDSITFGGSTPTLSMNSNFSVNIEPGITLSANTIFGGSGSGTLSVDNDISGSGGLEISSGNYDFSTTGHSFSGGFELSGGSLTIDRSTLGNGNGDIFITATGDTALGAGTISISGGNLLLDSDDDITLLRDISFSGGASTINTDDDMTIDGTISVSNGSVTFSNDGAGGNQLTGSGNYNLTGGDVTFEVGRIIMDGTFGVDGADVGMTTTSYVYFNEAITQDSGSTAINSGQDIQFNNGLTVNGGTFDAFPSRHAQINSDVTVTGTGDVRIDATGDVNVASGVTFQVDGGVLDLATSGASGANFTMSSGSTLDLNGGTTTIDAYHITIEGLTVDDATFDASAAGNLSFGSALTINDSTFSATTGNNLTLDQTIDINATGLDVDFQAANTININANLSLTDGNLSFVSTGNDVRVGSGVTIQQNGGMTTVDTGDASGHDFTVDATASLDLNGGSFTVVEADDNAINGMVDITNASLDLTSRVDTVFGSSLGISNGILRVDAGRHVNFNGAITVSGSGSDVDIQADADINLNASLTINEGSFSAVAGTDTGDDFTLAAAATIDVNGGNATFEADDINMSGAGSIDNASVNLTSLTDVTLDDLWEVGTSTGNGSLTINAGGAVDFAGGFNMEGTLLEIDSTGDIDLSSAFNATNGTLDLSSGGSTNITATTTIGAGASLTISGGDLLFDTGGTFDGAVTVHGDILVDTPTMANTPDITVASGVTNSIAAQTGSRSLTNLGTLTVEAGATTIIESSISTLSAQDIVLNAGTLILGADSQIGAGTDLIMDSGTLSTGGFNADLGALTLNSNSTIDMAGGSSVLTFDDASGSGLIVSNWAGNAYGGGVADQLIFDSALSDTFLDSVYWSHLDSYGARQLASGEIVPIVPEPGQWFGWSLLSLAIFRVEQLRRNMRRGQNNDLLSS